MMARQATIRPKSKKLPSGSMDILSGQSSIEVCLRHDYVAFSSLPSGLRGKSCYLLHVKLMKCHSNCQSKWFTSNQSAQLEYTPVSFILKIQQRKYLRLFIVFKYDNWKPYFVKITSVLLFSLPSVMFTLQRQSHAGRKASCKFSVSVQIRF